MAKVCWLLFSFSLFVVSVESASNQTFPGETIDVNSSEKELAQWLVLRALPGLILACIVTFVGLLYCLIRACSCGKCCSCEHERSWGCVCTAIIVFSVIGLAIAGFSAYGISESKIINVGIDKFMNDVVNTTYTAAKGMARTEALQNLSTIDSTKISDIVKSFTDIRKNVDDFHTKMLKNEETIDTANNIAYVVLLFAFITPLIALVFAALGMCIKQACGKCLFWIFMLFLWLAMIGYWLAFGAMFPTTQFVDLLCVSVERVKNNATSTEYNQLSEAVKKESPEAARFINACMQNGSFLGATNEIISQLTGSVHMINSTLSTYQAKIAPFKNASPEVTQVYTAITQVQENVNSGAWNPPNFTAAQIQRGEMENYLDALTAKSQKLSKSLTTLYARINQISPPMFRIIGLDKTAVLAEIKKAQSGAGDITILIDTLIQVNEVLNCHIVKELVGSVVGTLCTPLRMSIRGVTFAILAIAIVMVFVPWWAQLVVESHHLRRYVSGQPGANGGGNAAEMQALKGGGGDAGV